MNRGIVIHVYVRCLHMRHQFRITGHWRQWIWCLFYWSQIMCVVKRIDVDIDTSISSNRSILILQIIRRVLLIDMEMVNTYTWITLIHFICPSLSLYYYIPPTHCFPIHARMIAEMQYPHTNIASIHQQIMLIRSTTVHHKHTSKW